MFGAAKKIVRVVINGEETVSKASDQANSGLSGFASKAKTLIAGLAALGIGAALGGFFKRAIEESLGASAEMDRLRSVISGTGASFDALRPRVLDTVTALNRMSTFSQGELRTALGTMVAMTGDAEGSIANLGLATDLAAARGIPLEQATLAIAKAMAGNETALRKLMPSLKDSKDLFGDLEQAVGGAAQAAGQTLAGQIARAKDQFGEFANAVGDAILGSSELKDSGDVLVDFMVRLQDWTAANAEEIGAMTDAIVLLARNIGQTLMPIFRAFAPVATFALKAIVTGVMFLTDATRALVIVTQEAVGQIVKHLGSLVEKGGKILKIFGVDMVAGWGQTMQEWGTKTEQAASASWTVFRRESSESWAKLKGDAQAAPPPVQQALRAIGDDAEDQFERVSDASKKAGKAVKDHMGPTLADSIHLTTDALNNMRITASKALEPTQAAQFDAEMRKLVDRSHAVRDRIMGWGPAVEDATGKSRDLAREVETLARAGLDTATAFGVIDQQAAAVLNSVVNIAAALPKALAGDLTSMAGILGGVANIAKQIIGGDNERKTLLRDNTRGLDRLRSEIGNLRINVTGESFAKVQSVLSSVLPTLTGKGLIGQTNDFIALGNALRKQGLSFADLELIGKELGVNIKDSKGNISLSAVRQLFEAMGLAEFGQFGSGFSDQLDATTRGFDVTQMSGTGQLSSLFGLANRFGVTALDNVFDPSNLASTRARLGELFQGLLDGTIEASAFGGLTGTQFLDLITDMLKRTDAILGASTAPADVPSPAPAPSDGDVVVPGVGTVPGETVRTIGEVFASYAADTVPLFTQQVELQARIAEATEATASNTAATVFQLTALREALVGPEFLDRIDRALADRRRDAETAIGVGITL
jgi:hypothetical protein